MTEEELLFSVCNVAAYSSAILFLFYGFPIWALVNILQATQDLIPRTVTSFACVTYLVSNIVILGFLGKRSEKQKENITRAYLLFSMYFFFGSLASKVLRQLAIGILLTGDLNQPVNEAQAGLNIAHGAILICIIVKRQKRGEQLYQPKSLLFNFLIGTGFILIFPMLIVLFILKIVCPKQNNAPRAPERQPPAQQPVAPALAPAQIPAPHPQPLEPIPEVGVEPQAQIIQPVVPNVQNQPTVMDDKPELKFFQQGNKVNSYLIERELTHQPTMLKNADITCSICLEEFENQMNLTVLVKCKHVFHSACIKDWLNKNKDSCPLCRRSVYAPASWLKKQS